MKIGIIGVGFVGSAVKNAVEQAGSTTVCIDPYKGYLANYSDLSECEAVFVCVPSPVADDGSCDTSYLESVMFNLTDYTNVIISKTTAPADTYLKLQSSHPTLVHTPEFLRAVSANDDYLNQKFAIIGGFTEYCIQAEKVLRTFQKQITKVTHIPLGEACIVKYLENCFLATKVTFMNEIYNLCQVVGFDYNIVKDAIQFDTRQGHSHFDVPGPDGEFGFGGHCFPKDTSAMLKYARGHGVELTVLAQAVNQNKIIRNS
jgi:UDPglucose 6-dehydrogenase